MRAAVVSSPGRLSLDTVPDPTPAADEVVVAVSACGVCGTDLHVIDGDYPAARYPLVPGHEFAGTVVALGRDVRWIAVGTEVGVDPVVTCGRCSDCRAGWTNLCQDLKGYGVGIDGGMADFVAVRSDRLEVLPDGFPLRWAALAEPLSCVLHALDRMGPVSPGQPVLVIGAGPAGLMLVQMLSRSGGLVDVVERVPGRRGAAGAFGARRTAAAVDELEQPGGWDLVVEATGSVTALEAGLGAVRRTGRLHIFGVASPDAVARFRPFDIFERELTITGSQSLRLTYHRAVQVLAAGFLDADDLITHRPPLDDVVSAVTDVRSGVGIKTQLVV